MLISQHLAMSLPHWDLCVRGQHLQELRKLLFATIGWSRSLPTVNPVQERLGRPPNQMEQDPSQGGPYVWKMAVRGNNLKWEAIMMNIGGHIEVKGPLTKNKHTGCLPQEVQVGGFPTITLIEKDPWKRIP